MAINPIEAAPIELTPIQEIVLLRNDRYTHFTVRENENPQLAEIAWRIHAEGYHAMGFVKDTALTQDGFLANGIDKARGESVDYKLAIHPEDSEDAATVRKFNLSDGQSYVDLPAYSLCKDALFDEGKAFLDSIPNQEESVKEIAALARTANAHPIAVHELFRDIIHEAISKNETWFFSIVSSTHESLVKTLGKDNFWIIGEDVSIPDDRVNPEIKLRPIIVRPDIFIDNLLAAYENADNPVDKVRLQRSFIFFTEGLAPEYMSDSVRDAAQQMRSSN